MRFKVSEIKRILVVSLSNLGDVILTFPVIDILLRDFPDAKLSVVVGPKAESFLKANPHFEEIYVFDKRSSVKNKFLWTMELRKKRFDLVVDLRNTAIPILISAKHHTSIGINGFRGIHMKTKHLNRLKTVFNFNSESKDRSALHIPEADKSTIADVLKNKIGPKGEYLVVGPGAANHIKRWTESGFASLCDNLIELFQIRIVMVGDKGDCPVVDSIIKKMKHAPVNLCGETDLLQLAEILQHSKLVVVNDSAIMHLASYLDVPVVALFGPTDERKYGPWSSKSLVVRKKLFCSPCEKSGCAYQHECMEQISSAEVFRSISFALSRITLDQNG